MGELDGSDAVWRARAAAGRGDWGQAFELLRGEDVDSGLAASALPLLADVAYAAGHLDVTIDTWERVHVTCLRGDDPIGAAGAAARVAMHLLFDTALMAPVRGWLARAERLLEGQPETPAHAWHAVVRAYERLLCGDLPAARPWAERAVEVGERQDPAACAVGRVAQARIHILTDDVADGLKLLDEVGVAAVSGDLDPLSTGVVYCELVCALQGLAQYDQAEEWTEAMERWSQTNATGSLHGRCRVHRAEILRLRGNCDEAEAEAVAACDELRPYLRRELGWPLSELGAIRLQRGDLDGARHALVAAHHAGWDPQPGLALLRLAEGDVQTAAASIRDALERPVGVPSKERPPSTSLRRAPLLAAQVEIEIAANEPERARAATAELGAIAARFRSKALTASAKLALGQVRLAEGEPDDARRRFAEAARLWHEVGAPYETARARLGLAQAYLAAGSEEQAAFERDAAEAIIARMTGTEQPEPADRARAPGVSEQPARKSTDVFRREGDHWLVVFAGRSVRVRDRKGMRHLAHLLAEPGREIHAIDLAAAESGGTPQGSASAATVLTDAGAMVDDRARAAYQRRLLEIDDDIADARAGGDEARAEQASLERQFLTRELSRAFGLGGRARRAGSASERARAAVTRAIRKVIEALGEHHPDLAAHLERTIQTGTYCAYLPDPRTPTEWEM